MKILKLSNIILLSSLNYGNKFAVAHYHEFIGSWNRSEILFSQLQSITFLTIRFFLITVQENAEQGAIAFLGVVQVWESDLGVHLQHFPR